MPATYPRRHPPILSQPAGARFTQVLHRSLRREVLSQRIKRGPQAEFNQGAGPKAIRNDDGRSRYACLHPIFGACVLACVNSCGVRVSDCVRACMHTSPIKT